MKKLALLLLGTAFAFSVFAQSEKGYVHLKNGSILKGKYNYFDNNQKVKVESGKNLWIFDAAEIESIESKRNYTEEEIDRAYKQTDWFFRVDLGVLAGNSENSQTAPFSLTGSANYRVLPQFSVGMGTGLEFFNESYLPVFANAEYKLRKKSSSPYLFLKAGYQVPLEESNAIYYDVVPVWSSFAPWPGTISQEGFDTKGGFLVNPGLGYQQMITSGFGMNFAVGYQFHRLNYEGEGDYSLFIDYNRLSVKIGIIF